MDKEFVLQRIREGGLVAVVRATSGRQAVDIARACMEGGVVGIEITFTVPGADEVIRQLAQTFPNGEIMLGAGTVMDPETARIAHLAGAQYVVSPYLNPEVVRLCNRYRIPCMPGAMSVREVVMAMECGADIVKVFPAELFGPGVIKSILGPVPQARLMPTGGVSVENAGEWIAAGAVALGAGSSLTAGAQTGDYERVTRTARQFMEAIREARAALKAHK